MGKEIQFKDHMVSMQQTKLMKIFILFFVVMLFARCQEEYIQISDLDKSVAFTANDTIADLIMRVTLKDGSFDNIIDKCNEVSIKFPYSVKIKNEIITVTSAEDVEYIRQEYFQFINAITIKYPVTVVFSDYSESVLSNQGELQKIKNQYNTNLEDDDIECIDFIYPLEVNLYNAEFQKPDFVVVGDDKDLHGILKNMKDMIVEVGYPIQVELFDGTMVNISNNLELKNEIMNVMGSCDEGDEVEFITEE